MTCGSTTSAFFLLCSMAIFATLALEEPCPKFTRASAMAPKRLEPTRATVP